MKKVFFASIFCVASFASADTESHITNGRDDTISHTTLCSSAENVEKSFARIPLSMTATSRIEAVTNAGSFIKLWAKSVIPQQDAFKEKGEDLNEAAVRFLNFAVNSPRVGVASSVNEPLRVAVVSAAAKFLIECKNRITIKSSGQ